MTEPWAPEEDPGEIGIEWYEGPPVSKLESWVITTLTFVLFAWLPILVVAYVIVEIR